MTVTLESDVLPEGIWRSISLSLEREVEEEGTVK
jgi:hypothetical protein